MRTFARVLPAVAMAAVFGLSGCGYLDDGANVDVTISTKTVTVSGTVRDESSGDVAVKPAPQSSSKPKSVPEGGCPEDSFIVRVGEQETCSIPLGGGIHEYEITADVSAGAGTVVVHFRRDGFPPSSQAIVLSGDGETVAPTFSPRVYDTREEVDETTTFTVEADAASDDDGEADAIIEIQPNTTDDEITVNVLVVDPSNSGDRNLLPGDQVDADEQELEQLTAVEITLSDSDGEEVQPADDKPITVTLTLPPAAANSVRDLIASGTPREGLQVGWRSFNEDKEVWEDEDADPTTPGLQGARVIFEGDGDDADPVSVRALISHLTWYAAGEVIQPSEQGCLAVSVEDADGNPVDDVVVELEGEGEAFGDQAITDSTGVAYLDSLISTDSKSRTVSIAAVRNGSTVARLTAQAAPTTGGVSAEQQDSCDLGPVLTINVEGTVTGTVVRGFQRNAAASAAVFIESTDDGIDGLARATTDAAGAYSFTVPTPFNFEVFAGNDSQTGTLAAAAVTADAGELFLGNTAPNNASIDASASITVPGGSISLTGVATDIDGDSVSYAWSAPEGTFSSATGETVSWTAPDSPSGSTLITVTVSDGELSATATLTLNWDEVNVAPTIDSISSSNGGNVPNGGTATITAAASDANSEDTLSYSWTTNVGSIGTGSESVQFTAPANGFGSATITLEVSDGEFTVSDTFTQGFGTPPNQAPVIFSTSRTPDGNVSRGAAVDVFVSASDADSSPSPLSISWTATGGSFNGATDGSTAQWLAPDAIGSFDIVVTVSDGEDSDTETLTVVVGNAAPVISSATSNPAGSVGKASTVALTAVASDPDGDPITYQWTADSGGFNGSTTQETAEWIAPETGGTAVITVTVSDGLLEDSETISLTVSSNGPVINSLTANPSGDVQRGTSVALSSDVSDPDGDDITYQWSANIGSFSGSTTDPAASWVAPNASGNAVITLTVSDGEFTTADTVEFAVLNHQPVINSATADPSGTVAKSTVISLSSDVTDNDGDATLSWSASNGSFNGATDQATAEWVAPAAPGLSTITLTVTDGEFTSSEEIEITVVNGVPVIDSVTQTPSGNVSKGASVLFESLVSDSDGDDITYSWTANAGSFSSAVDGPNATWNASAVPGSYQVTLTVSDGTDSDEEVIVVVVVNAAPVANDDVVSTDQGNATSISVLANDSDADGDVISIEAITIAPSNGVASVNGSQVDYTPNGDFVGEDSFTYRIGDGFDTDTAVVTVTVVEEQTAAFGDFNGLSWGGALESDSRFGNNKRLSYYSSLYSVSMVDDGAGEVGFTVENAATEYFMELNTSDGFSNIYAEQEEEDFGGEVPAKTDSGAIYVNLPNYNDSESEYASIELAQTVRLLPAGDNHYIGSEFYSQLSSLRPVVTELGASLNTTQTLDDDFEPALQLYTRRAESFDISVLSGDYGVVTQRLTLRSNADRGVQGHVGVFAFSSGVGSTDSLIVSSMSRESGSFTNGDTFGFQEVLDPGETIDYNLAAPSGDLTGRIEGDLQLQPAGGGSEPAEALDGYADPEGKVFTLVSPLFDTDEVQLSITRGVRLGSGVVESDLHGKTYLMVLHNIGMSDNDGDHSIETESAFRLRFNADGSVSYLCGAESHSLFAERDSDSSAPEGGQETSADDGGDDCTSDGNIVTGVWSLDNDRGQLTLTQTDGGFSFDIRGFISEGLDQLAFSEYEAPDGGFYSSGIVLGTLASEDRFDNTAPQITVNTGVIEPILLSHGESIDLQATTTDSDGDPVTVEWFAAGMGSFSSESGATTTFTAPLHGHGEGVIFATARDGKSTTNITLNVEFGPGYASGATAEQHALAATDIDEALLEADDVTNFLAGFNPWTEVGTCLPFDSNGDGNDTTGSQSRTHVDSGGADATGQDLQVGDVIELAYSDCLEDDEFDDAYSDGTITLTMTQVSSGSGDGLHTFAWIAAWDYEGRDIENGAEEIDLISGQYTVTQTIEVEDGEDESRLTRIEMVAGQTPTQELRFEYTAPVGDSYNYGFTEGVSYVEEGTVIVLEEDQFEWELSYTFHYSDFPLDESVERLSLTSTTAAPFVGNVENGGLGDNVDYRQPTSGIVRLEIFTHPEESFTGTRVVVLDVQFNDSDDFSSEQPDILITVIEDWDGSSNDYDLVAQSDFDILDDPSTATEGERYALLPPSFDGQKYRLMEIGRGFFVTPSLVSVQSSAELSNFGIADGPELDTVEIHFGENLEKYINLDSHGSFSTFEETETDIEDEKDVLPVENGHIFASFDTEFTLDDVCVPGNEVLATANGGDVYVSIYADACQGFDKIDTDGDFEPDGFDGSSRHYNEVSRELVFFVKGESSATNADLAGDYGLVTFLTTLGTGGSAYQNQVTMLKNVSLDANGDYVESSPVDANLFLIDRDEDGGPFVVSVEELAFNGVTDLDLEVQADGDVTGDFEFENGDFGELDGAASISSGLIVATGFFDGEGTDRGLIEHILLKRATTPLLNNTQWLVQGVAVSHDFVNADSSWLATGVLADDLATMVIDGSGNITWSGIEDEALLDISSPDGGTFIEVVNEDSYSVSGVVDTTPAAGDVALVFTEPTSEVVLEGYQSVDGSMMVMRIRGQDDGTETDGFAFTGAYVLTRNDAGIVPNQVPSKGSFNDPGVVTAGTTAELTISGVTDPEAEPLSYHWYASFGSFSTATASSEEVDGVQVLRDAGTTVTWHAPASIQPGESALIHVDAEDGVRYSRNQLLIETN